MNDQDNPFVSSVIENATNCDTASDQAEESILENLELTAKITRICSLCIGLWTIHSIIVWSAGFWYLLPLEYGWTFSHVRHIFNGFANIAFAFFAWRVWLFSKSIKAVPIHQTPEFAKFIERQTWVWIAIGFLVFLLLALTGMSFSASFIYSNTEW